MLSYSPSPPPFLATPGPACVPWRQWKLAFLNYLEAVGGDDFAPKRRRAILLNALGLEGQRIYNSVAPTTPASVINEKGKEGVTEGHDEKNVFDEALDVLDNHFSTATNELMKRHRFRQRRQLPGEAFEAYAAALRELSSDCNFGEAADKTIRDQLLEGTASQQIRERLLFEGTSLTLNRAVDLSRHIKQTQRELKEFAGDPVVQRVVDKPTSGSTGKASTASCYRCGSTAHRANAKECPAKDKTCRNCNKRGHFAAVCKTKRRQEGPLLDTASAKEPLWKAERRRFASWTPVYEKQGSKRCIASPGGPRRVQTYPGLSSTTRVPFSPDTGTPRTARRGWANPHGSGFVVTPLTKHLLKTRVAALHFNENGDREQAISGAGQRQWKRKSPKAKKEHPTIAEEKTKATHAYVAKLLAQAVLICEEIGPLREAFKRDREMPT
ncbi:uncharacterized protein ISCGN_007385 [Ixodes scapularis]